MREGTSVGIQLAHSVLLAQKVTQSYAASAVSSAPHTELAVATKSCQVLKYLAHCYWPLAPGAEMSSRQGGDVAEDRARAAMVEA